MKLNIQAIIGETPDAAFNASVDPRIRAKLKASVCPSLGADLNTAIVHGIEAKLNAELDPQIKATLEGAVSRGIRAAEIDDNGHLIFTLTDNSTVDLGPVVGFSPYVTVEQIIGGHRVTITDADGPHTFDVMDGSGSGASSWQSIFGKPFETIGENLKVVGGALTVDTADIVQQDNTKPITSAAVYTEVGNIAALLASI